jgi:hypothetical protein
VAIKTNFLAFKSKTARKRVIYGECLTTSFELRMGDEKVGIARASTILSPHLRGQHVSPAGSLASAEALPRSKKPLLL